MKRSLLLLILIFSITGLSAQRKNKKQKTGFVTCSEFHITRPLRDIFAENPVDETKPYEKHESEDRENRKPQKFRKSVADGPEYGNDLKGIQIKMGDVPGRAPLTSWAGQTASGFRPYDPSGAAGLTQYVQMINSTTFKVYNKTTGAVTLTATLGNLWSPATANAGDPIVLYDKAADRWLLAQFGSSTDKKIYIAISTTGDATGTYYTYTFVSPLFPDYLKFGVWSDGYYMTSNQGTQKVFAFERAAMLAGNAASRAVYTNFSPPNGTGFFVPLPADASDGTLPLSGTPCPIFSYSDNNWGAGYNDAVNIYQMAVDWVPATPTATITLAANVATAAFDATYDASWNDVAQPITTQKLDGIGGVCMYRAQWKSWSGYNTIVLNWAVKISSIQRSIKWCELRQDQTTGTWSMYQEGIYTPDGATRWMGSIAMDNNGSIGLAYMKTDSANVLYPGLYYTGRRSCDPPGTLPIVETQVITGTGYQTGTNRNGDYSQLVLDPDGVTFWYTSEYMGGTSGGSAARTHIFSYQIAPCGNAAGVYISQTAGSNPQCPGASATFTATPTNGGTTPVYQWQVNGVNAGTNSPTFTTTSLTNGQIVSCIMTSNMVGVTGNPATSNTITMTVNPIVTPTLSIALTAGSNPSCSGSSVSFTATPTNGGTTPAYQWKVNGVNAGTNSSVFSTSTLTNGQVITCDLTSNAICTTTSTATSNGITMGITPVGNATASISQTSGTNPLCTGASVSFTATVSGGTASVYQWKVDGVNAGTNNPLFTTSSLTNGQLVTCDVTATATCPNLTIATLGTATTLNATTSPIGAAYPTYYGNGRQQYIIKASELTALGLSAGNISSLGFSVAGTTGDPVTLNGYTIKIGTTTATTASTTFRVVTYTTVFGPVNYTPVLNALNTHSFSTPFAWNGTSNLAVDICFSNQVVGNVAYQTYNSAPSPSFTCATYYQADGSTGAGACSQLTGTTTTRRPNMTISIGSGSATATVTSNTLTMSVGNPATISNFSPVSGSPGTSVTITGTGFVNVTNVLFNGVAATSFTVNSSTQITAVVPSTTSGLITVVTTPCGAVASVSNFTIATGVTLNLKLFIQGFYRGSGTMVSIVSPGLTDTVTVQLAAAVSPYSILYTKTGPVSISGTGSFVFPSAPVGASYYIVLKHRNGLETWSASPVLFASASVSYDFTTALSMAYGSNQKDLADGNFAIWNGDVNQDGSISSTDYNLIESSSQGFLFGYVTNDLTGDNLVESADYSLIENNSQLFIIVSRP